MTKLTINPLAILLHHPHMETTAKRYFPKRCWTPMETEEGFQVSSCDPQECHMVSGAWSMKMMAAHMKEIGGMDDGMDMGALPSRTVIHMKESIDLINVMEGEFIVGQMDVSMMARLVKTSDMVRGPLSGLMEQLIKGISFRVNVKGMVDIPFLMEDTMWDLGSMVGMMDLGNVVGKMDVPTRVNGRQEWLMDKVLKHILMGVCDMMDNGIQMSPLGQNKAILK